MQESGVSNFVRSAPRPRVALVHDYLNQRGGAERVFAHVAAAYPDAPVYTSLYDRALADIVAPARVHASFLDRLPLAHRAFRWFAPLYPAAFEAFDLTAYDVIVSTTTAWAKGVRFRADAVHVCYIHTVSRFVFDYDRYVGGFGAAALARPVAGALARWDRAAAKRPTAFFANSRNVAERVRRFYGRDAGVLYCPVDVDRFTVGTGGGGYFLLVSRLLSYKCVDRAIAACALANVALVVVGSGPAEKALRALARGTRTSFRGGVSDAELRALMGAAEAVIVPGEEDFGLVPLEANASGRPAIAFARGGALETIVPGVTGELFDEPTPESLAAVLRRIDARRYDASAMRTHAERFRPERFVAELRANVDAVVASGARGGAREQV